MSKGAPQRKTVGALAVDLLSIHETRQINVNDLSIELNHHQKYLEELHLCANRHKDIFEGDFYVSVLTTIDKNIQNAIRSRFMATRSCPTPMYGQDVYRYEKFRNDFVFIWTIPDKNTCLYLLEHYKDVSQEEQWLLALVVKFASGELMEQCKILNNETADMNNGIVTVVQP